MAKYVRVEVMPPPANPTNPIWAWIVLLGIPPLVYCIGFAMTGYINFWLGLFIMGAVSICFAASFFNIPEISRKRRLCGVAIIALIYITTVWLVYAPAPLDTLITTVDANYEDGSSTVIGVPWKSDYWPVNIRIGNDTDHVYDGYDAYIRTDLTIAKVGIRKSINNCVASLENPLVSLFNPEARVPKNGKYITIPFNDDQALSTFYRIRCDKIAAHSSIQVLLAIVGGRPSWAGVASEYIAAGLKRTPPLDKQCFLDTCPNMPKNTVELER